MHLDFWGATDIGCVRSRNEDHFVVDPSLGLAVVADGIGGQHRGDIAGALACRAVREHLQVTASDLDRFRADPTLLNRRRVEERLREAVQSANIEIFRAGQVLAPTVGMGCTLEVLIVLGTTGFLGHVGDARTYHVREGRAVQVTVDHTVAQEKVNRGLITAAQAETAPEKNMLTRSVGGLPSVRVDTHVFEVAPGHRLLLCSDGVTRYVSGPEIAALATARSARPVEEIVELARVRGGIDNITAVLVVAEAKPPILPTVTAVQIEQLRRCTLLESATSRELRLVASVAERIDAKTGRILFREGQAGSEMYIVVEGEVLVTRGGHHLDTIRPGGCFGEMALLDSPIRSASAIVTQNAVMYVLSRHRFEQLLHQDDGVSARLMWGLLRRLSHIVRQQNDRLFK